MENFGTEPLTRLHPGPVAEVPFCGVYLDHGLRRCARERPYVYSNFVASLDGRVARPDPANGRWGVPPEVANPRDWRLYMELAMQADVVLSSGRLLRAVAAGRQRALLDFGNDQCEDLRGWRRRQGLAEWPAVAALTRRPDDSAATVARDYAGPIVLLTPEPAAVPAAAHRAGVRVAAIESTTPDAAEVVAALAREGFGTIYSIAGPTILHTLLAGRLLDRLYLTTVLRLLAGNPFEALVRGPALGPPADARLAELYLDPHAEAQQLFGVYDLVR